MTHVHLVFLFMATLGFALILSPVIIKLSRSSQLMDVANQRSAHVQSTPRGGGLIFIIASGCVFLLNSVFHFFHFPHQFLVIIILSYACALLGLLDDRFSLPSWFRFVAQILLVLYPVLHMPLIFTHSSSILQYLLYLVSWVWFINLFNFMDGTDGYAAQEALFIFLLIGLIGFGCRPLVVVLCAAILGFLKVNYPKASIFMGDAGSYFLGYLLFGSMIYHTTHHVYLFVPCVIVSLLFTFDADLYTYKKNAQRRVIFSSASDSLLSATV